MPHPTSRVPRGVKKGPPLLGTLLRVLPGSVLEQPSSDAQAFPILNILVLQTGQAPSVAGLPFFIVMGFGSFISRFTLHLRQ